MKRFISRLIFIFCLFLSVFSCVEPELIVGQGQNQNQTELSIGSDGGIFTIPISSNVDFTCSLSNDCKSWCSITQTKAMNDYSIILTVKENDTYDSRTGTLTISYAEKSTTLTITQSQKDELILTQKEFIVGTEGGELKIPVSTNIQYSCTVMEGAQGWITIKQAQTKGLEDYNIVLQIAKNESYDGRIGQVKISGAGKESFITITQKQVDAFIIDQQDFAIGSDGGNITIPLRSNIDYSCSLSDDCKSWCSITQTKALNDYNIILSVAKNNGYDPRTGTLTISYGDKSTKVTITQSQKDEIILTQKEFTIGIDGGELRIPVLTNINYTATVLGNAQSWIEISQVQTKGLEQYHLVLQIAKNESYDGRVGQVKISGAGKESFITITQKQVVELIVDQQYFSIGSDGGTITIPVSSNVDYSCSLSDDCKSWCTITQTKALNNYNIILSVAKNEGYDPRTGTLTISYGDNSTRVTITQSQKDELILTQKEFTIGTNGGVLRIPVLTNINYTATVLGDAQSWITILQVQTKGLERYNLVLQIANNESYDGRVGQVKISGAGKESFITITQKQVDALIVDQREFSIGSGGGTITIPLRSNIDYSCSLSDNCKSWCSITQTKALNNYNIVISVAKNEGYDPRIGTLTISSGDKSIVVTITQSQKDEFILTQKEFIIGCEGGELKIPVAANIQYSCAVVEGAQDWITIEQAQTKGLEDYKIVLKIAKNESYDGRVGQVKISGAGKESFITITQKQVDALIVEQKEFSIGSDGGNITIPLRSNIDYSCSLSDNCKSWCSITQTKALNNYNIVISVAKNEGYDPRIGTLTISSGDKSIVVTITQSQKDEFILTQKEFIIGCEGGELKIPVAANIQYSCAVVEGAQDWITIEQAQTKGLEDYKIVLKIAKNESYDGRVGQVKISGAGKESFITITQKQVDALIVEQKEFSIGSDGGNITIPLRSNIDYSCSLSDNCKSWCSITQTKALNDYNIILSVAKNEDYDPRTGTLTISSGDKSIAVTITQSQKDELIVTEKEFTIGIDGGVLGIPVLTNINYTATVLGDAQSWITILQVQTKGLERYNLVLQIANNESYDGRVGQVKISGAGKESFITITQKQVEELIVDQKEFSIGSDGGTITIPVISNVDYSCSLSDNCKSWCSITQTKALNNYNIILSVAKNEGYDPRTGTLTISYGDNSTRVTITQSQKDELILTQKEFTIGTNGGVLRIPVLTNINYTATVLGDAQSWIGIYQVQTKGLEEYKLVLQIAKNSAMTGRVGQVKISGAGKESFITITQGANEEPSALGKERTALTALYNSLNGNQWTRKDNWLTDKPLDE